MSWNVFKGTEAEWQTSFLRYNGNYRQSYQWGNYKSCMKWNVLRLVNRDKKGNLDYVQITYKKFLFFCAAYIPGEIIGQSKNLDSEFKKKILQVTKSKILYLRFDSTKKYSLNENKILKINGWNKPYYQKQTPIVSTCNLEKNIDDIINKSSEGWKKNYLKSVRKFNQKEFNIEITNKPSPNQLVYVSNVLTRDKKIFKPHSEKEFKNMVDVLNKNIVFCQAFDNKQVPIAYRGMIYFGDYAWDLSAATTTKGRDLLSSFYITIELLKHCKSLGVKNYNFGEMDKIKKTGVYHFKQGIAKNEYEISGEWEFSNFYFINKLSNFFISVVLSYKIRKIIPFINKLKF